MGAWRETTNSCWLPSAYSAPIPVSAFNSGSRPLGSGMALFKDEEEEMGAERWPVQGS